MNAGPGGFSSASVTKGLLLTTAAASVFAQAARASRRHLPRLLHFAHPLIFRAPGELLFGAILVYYFRYIERQRGSEKHGTFGLVTTGLAYGLHHLVSRALPAMPSAPSGPYPYIFACFTHFFFDTPATSKFSFFGVPLTDKVGQRSVI